MSRPSPRILAGGLLAAAGLVALTTVLARVLGLGRWLAFSHSVGATCVGQVYATANQVPNVLYEIAAGGALAAVVVPLVSRFLHSGDEASADRTASALVTWALTLLVPLAVVVAVAARPLSAALLGGDGACGEGAVDAAAVMLRIFAPQLALYGVGIVLAGVLQAHRRFFAAALAPLLSSLVAIITYLTYGAMTSASVDPGLTTDAALLLLAGGTTLAVVALSLPLLLPTVRAGVRLRPTWQLPPDTGRSVRRLALAGALAVAAQQVCVLVTVRLTNTTGPEVGLLNVYSYAQVAYLLPYAVLVVPLATVAFPRLTERDLAERVLRRTTAAALAAAVLGTAALVAARREVGAVFGQLDAGADGAGASSLAALPPAVGAYAPGLLGLAAVAVLSRALYARGVAVPTGLAIALGWLLAALLPAAVLAWSGPLSPSTRLAVLGWGSSLGMAASAVVLARLVRHEWGAAALAGVWRPATAAATGAAVAVGLREVLAVWGPGPQEGLWSDSAAGAALAAAVVAVAVLLAAGAALRVGDRPTFETLVQRIARRGGD